MATPKEEIIIIFFWFIFLLPLVLLVYTLMAKSSLSVSMLCDTVTTEKNTPYTYEFTMNSLDDNNGRIEFNMGHRGSTAELYITNVRLEIVE